MVLWGRGRVVRGRVVRGRGEGSLVLRSPIASASLHYQPGTMPELNISYQDAFDAFIIKLSDSNRPIQERFGELIFDKEVLEEVDEETLLY